MMYSLGSYGACSGPQWVMGCACVHVCVFVCVREYVCVCVCVIDELEQEREGSGSIWPYLQLENSRGQECSSMGKLFSLSWHSASMVNLQKHIVCINCIKK